MEKNSFGFSFFVICSCFVSCRTVVKLFSRRINFMEKPQLTKIYCLPRTFIYKRLKKGGFESWLLEERNIVNKWPNLDSLLRNAF